MITRYEDAKFLLVAGSRKVNPSPKAKAFVNLKGFLERHSASPRYVIHGNAKGADQIGGLVRNEYNADCIIFDAMWAKFGRSAGYRRNEQMAEFLPPEHSLACLFVYADEYMTEQWQNLGQAPTNRPRWSKGTTHMYDLCKQRGIRTKVFYI